MNSTKKFKLATWLFSLLLVFSLGPFSSLSYADEPNSNQNSDASQIDSSEQNQSIAILFTNDVHCKIDYDTDERDALGYAGVAAYKNAAEKQYGENNVTLVDAGDAVQGGVAGTITKGEAITELMNFVGYDYAVPGNHEFDFGMDQFDWFVQNFSGTYLSCNFTTSNGNQPLSPYVIQSYPSVNDNNSTDNDDMLKIAYIGITTPETLSSSNPSTFQDGQGNYIYDFCNDSDGEKLYSMVQNTVNQARNDGADCVIAIGHLGNTGITNRWTSESVIKNTTGIDAFIDGHSHESYCKEVQNKSGETVTLAQTGTKLTQIGELTITPALENQDIAVKLTSYQDFSKVDEETAQQVEAINDNLVQQAGQTVGTSEVNLVSEDESTGLYVRYHETNLADFIADAYRTTLDTDIAFINGGGVRASLQEGEITLMDLITVQPFSNNISKVKVSGQTILDALEMGVSEYPEPSGGFLQTSGLTYTFDASIESPVIVDEYDNFVAIEGQRRVTEVKVNGEPLDPNKEYTVASINYLLFDGGSGMSMFNDNTVTVLAKDVTVDNQAIVDYLSTMPNQTITKNEYGNPEGQGRITVLNDNNPYYPKNDDPTPPITDDENTDAGTSSDASSSNRDTLTALNDSNSENYSSGKLPDTADETKQAGAFLVACSILGLSGLISATRMCRTR